MQARMMFLHGISPIHTGTGQSVDVVDLPIAREKTTGWPYIPGSSIKGVLRDECAPEGESEKAVFIRVFGPDTDNASDSAGSVLFCDGHLLCFPVRSFKGTFAWITCPSVLSRLSRDYAVAPGLEPFPDGSHAPQFQECVVCSESAIVQDSKVYLEDLDINVIPNSADDVANDIAAKVFEDETWRNHFKSRFAIVSDDLFTFLTDTATDVVARIKMEDNTKTVQDGGLWYEEAVPTESIFWCPLLADPRNGDSADDLFRYIIEKKKPVIQIGGNASVGRGLVRVIITGGE